MNEPKKYISWIRQAQDDLLWGKDSLSSKHYAQTCFIAQQVGEKALKALAFYRGADMVKSHSLVQITQELKINGELLKAARKLDLYYISTRYPDALPGMGMPSEYFGEDQAQEAILLAESILNKVIKELGH